jgi:hypothetical protein
LDLVHLPSLSGRAVAGAALLAVLLLALVLRLAFALEADTSLRPDSVFQTLEPAHRLVYGWGIVTWEWRDGIRSWLLPGTLAALMFVTRALFADPDTYLTTIPVVLCVGSLTIVVAAFALGWRTGRLTGALLAALAMATWPDLVLYAPRTLTEVQSVPFLVVASVLATLMPWRGVAGDRPVVVAVAIGACLGIAMCLRFQLAPAVAVIGLWAATRCTRRALPVLIAGFIVPLALQGLSDAIILGSPFQSIWKNVSVNIVENRAASFGVSPFLFYVTNLLEMWGAAILPMGVLFILGARRAPIPAVAALAIVVSHSFVAHKEAAFIYAAIPLAMLAAGVGLSEAVRLLPLLLRRPPSTGVLGASMALLWVVVAALTGPGTLRIQSQEDDRGLFGISALLRKETGLCGLALYGRDFAWASSGGYAYFNRPVPMSIVEPSAAPIVEANALVYMQKQTVLPAGWTQSVCKSDYCIARIDQACTPNPDTAINAVLLRTAQ